MLGLLGVAQPSSFSLKAFRAGHATELVARGASWSQLLEAGEWRGSAALKYVEAGAVDTAAFAARVIDASSDEDC